jgi:predicted dehydrogenase
MKFSRRDVLKGLGGLPVLGLFGLSVHKNRPELLNDNPTKFTDWGIDDFSKYVPESYHLRPSKDVIRLGLVGNGSRGIQILRALGYASDEWVERNRNRESFRAFSRQHTLHVEVTAISDVFSVRVDEGVDIVKNGWRSDGTRGQKLEVKGYTHYLDMLKSNEIDAVLILSPDHWHATMAIDCIKAGKHVYLEKPMTRTEQEAVQLLDVVKGSGLVFQVGHQNRQQVSHILARDLIEKNVLGKITLIETSTNRNSPHGAWNRAIHPEGNLNTIDWKLFLGSAPWHEFDVDRFFNWQKWFEYGTSVAGNQFTHYYDAVNQIMHLGIPHSVIASGGNYFYHDGRNIPDVFHSVFEYPDKELSLIYGSSLASSMYRGKIFRGNEAYMEVGDGVIMEADNNSEQYASIVKQNTSPSPLLLSFDPSSANVDGSTSATQKFYNRQGVLYTYINHEMIDVTYLHIKEWVDCIREGGQPSCDIDAGFEETITFRMANVSYLEKRQVTWDKVKRAII